jgi:hypothetical protein
VAVVLRKVYVEVVGATDIDPDALAVWIYPLNHGLDRIVVLLKLLVAGHLLF